MRTYIFKSGGLALFLFLLVFFLPTSQAGAEWRGSWDMPLGMEKILESSEKVFPPFVKSESADLHKSRSGKIRPDSPQLDPLDFDFDNENPDDLNIAYEPVPDPLEPMNRAFFYFNDLLYTFILKPITVTYETIAPEPVRTCVQNFFHNLAFPIRFVSLLLQGHFEAAGVEFSRFIMNTTFGIGGLFNPAQHLEARVDVEDTDLGQAFASWGIGHGIYLYLPILGPSSLRDGIGMVGAALVEPPGYFLTWYQSLGLWGFEGINKLSFTYENMEALHEAAIDPYTAFKDAYLQYREVTRPNK